MSTTKLTKTAIEKVAPERGKVQVLNDSDIKGFGIRIGGAGRRVFFYRYRVGGRGGKQRRVTLGKFGDLTVEEARRTAKRYAGQVAVGEDPVGIANAKEEALRKAQARKESLRIGEVLELYLEKHLKPNLRQWQDAYSVIRLHGVKPLRNKPIDEITRADIARLMDANSHRPATALKTYRNMSAMLNWALRRGLIDLSPMIGTKAPRAPVARDRVLSDNEVKLFWNSMPQAGEDFAPIFKTLLLTGQRRSEVAGMAWSELDLAKGVWTIPAERSKNKQPHDVDLSPSVSEIIEAQPRLGRYVFGGAKPNSPSGFGRAKRRVDAEMIRLRDEEYGVDSEIAQDWRLHDLRRTAATGMAMLGFPIEVVERVLNHISNTRSGIAAVYQRYHYRDERRDALVAWAVYVTKLVCDPTCDPK